MDPAYVAAHVEEDRRHWWFRGRLAVLLAALRRELPRRPLKLLELGCGTGNVLGALGEFGEAVGMEEHPVLITAARAAGLDVRSGHLPGDLPVPAGWADVVLLLDVLEHLDDPAAALATARRALGPGGALVVMVPAYQWLWSGHDVALGHRRRYTARALRRLVTGAGFRVTRVSYFNTLLFPVVAAGRTWKWLAGDARHDLRRPAEPWNRWLERVFALERHLVPRLPLPFGSSLLLLARA
ncbi:MAG: class I SAM-dependent methyltransferase [Candidatus Rokubacteria bacterium]|nr:class I SAM-dependent methyltransferase [Candidatus Rokubacteria bacterium]MBI2155815.1 class I SAM-dependent methyltransferase [Candidatus Rokubacteria bacterium]MBI2491714.1 class I SAM-dependent methyltransferase [Candidatus Rokubacteria bacterium]